MSTLTRPSPPLLAAALSPPRGPVLGAVRRRVLLGGIWRVLTVFLVRSWQHPHALNREINARTGSGHDVAGTRELEQRLCLGHASFVVSFLRTAQPEALLKSRFPVWTFPCSSSCSHTGGGLISRKSLVLQLDLVTLGESF